MVANKTAWNSPGGFYCAWRSAPNISFYVSTVEKVLLVRKREKEFPGNVLRFHGRKGITCKETRKGIPETFYVSTVEKE